MPAEHEHRFETYEPTWDETPWMRETILAKGSRFYRCSICKEPGFAIPPAFARYLEDVEEEA